MKIRIHNAIVATTTLTMVFVLVFIVGCGVQQETLETIRQIPAYAGTEQVSRTEAVAVTHVSTTFNPSYPDRVDPFSFPEDTTLESSGSNTSIQSAAQVDVIGFADLGQPRVFLRARDKTHSLMEGESIYGVEVVEINPPAVRLRMGSLTWTANMFAKSLP